MSNPTAGEKDRITKVLVDHFLHNTEFTGIPGGRWAIQCNCDEILFGASHDEAEQAFARHQAKVVMKLG